jgi:peptide/nickel transport system permease protein
MSEPAVHGKSYGEIVVSAFRKNSNARVALWISVVMLSLATLTPLIANDRPFLLRGTMPGEYRKSFNQLTRGAYFNLLGLPGRLREETEKFQKRTATEADLIRRVDEQEARLIFGPIARLHQQAESKPEIRGRWSSREEPLEELLSLVTPEEKATFETVIARIVRDLPKTYQGLADGALSGVHIKLMELGDQLDPGAAVRAASAEAKIRSVVDGRYLAGEDRKAVLKAAFDEAKGTFDPEKAELIPKTRFPLLDSLDGLDVFFIVVTLLAFLAFGPLTWWKLKTIRPLGRRWKLTWVFVVVPAILAGLLWEAGHDVKFQSVSYKRGSEEGTIVSTASLWPPIRYRYDEVPEVPPGITFPTAPDRQHWFGTDFMGRDLLSRMLWGSRISLSIGFVSAGIAVAIGVVLGVMAGYYRGWVDMGLSRVIEIMLCFPSFFVILAVIAFLPPSILYVMLALGLLGWMSVARLQRGEFFRLMGQDFVVSARALGATNRRTMFRHILPNALSPVLVAASFQIASAMLTESSLSFLGLGVQEPATSWGQILYTGRTQLQHWWTFVIPGAAIFVAVTCYNLVGDGIRDAVDPRLKT